MAPILVLSVPSGFRKKLRAEHQGLISRRGYGCCHFSQCWSCSFQLKLLFTEALPQDYNYGFCLVIKRVWVLHQRKRKQLTQRCGVNLSHSLPHKILVVCRDLNQSMGPWDVERFRTEVPSHPEGRLSWLQEGQERLQGLSLARQQGSPEHLFVPNVASF